MLQVPWFRSVNLAMDGPTARRWQSLCGGWAEARELSRRCLSLRGSGSETNARCSPRKAQQVGKGERGAQMLVRRWNRGL